MMCCIKTWNFLCLDRRLFLTKGKCVPHEYILCSILIFSGVFTPYFIYIHIVGIKRLISIVHGIMLEYQDIYRNISCFLSESISSLPPETYCVVNLKSRYEQRKSPANSFLNGGRVIASVSTLERLLFVM